MTEKKRKPKMTAEIPVNDEVHRLEIDLETSAEFTEFSGPSIPAALPVEEPPKPTANRVAYYRNILYTPTGHIVPSMSAQTLLVARRTYGDILDRAHGVNGTLDDLYGAYERSSVKQRAEYVRTKVEFLEGLDNLIKMGIFQRYYN